MNFTMLPCRTLAFASVLALFTSPASAQSDVSEGRSAPETPMASCLEQVAERATPKNAPISKPASYARCFDTDQIRSIEDVLLRFSSNPALGGIGYEVSIRPFDAQSAAVRVVIVFGHPDSGWIEQLSAYSGITRARFEELRIAFDAAVEAEPVSLLTVDKDGNEAILVCTDGPGYLAEIVERSGARSIEGFCGTHPNKQLAAEIESIKSVVLSEFIQDRNDN